MVDLFQPSFLLEVIIIFDWLGDIISSMGDAIGNVFSGFLFFNSLTFSYNIFISSVINNTFKKCFQLMAV